MDPNSKHAKGSLAIPLPPQNHPHTRAHDAFADDAWTASKYTTQPVDLAWQNLTLSVPHKAPAKRHDGVHGSKTILRDMSGVVRSGQMLAVMGSSGAGKTSLLNLLAGRITTSKGANASGAVYVNGEPRDYSKFRRMSAYVLQDDDMFTDLTVREQIAYAARLRLPSSMSNATKMARVDRVIQELGLSKVKHDLIGGALVRGISGGERKRVSIATELVTDPALLFLDEPTTGLDAFNALNVMQSLRNLACAGRTIVSTIHQPRSQIFQLFDQLLLLSDGRVMYHGPAQDAVAYFASLDFKSPPNFNPADFFIDLLSVDLRTPEAEVATKARIARIGDAHAAATPPLPVAPAPDPEAALGDDTAVEPDLDAKGGLQDREFQNSWVKELRVLTERSLKLAARARSGNLTRLLTILFFSGLVGIIWLNIGLQSGVPAGRSIGGVLFFMTVNQAFGGANSVIFQFPMERSIVTRERASNMYRVSAYFVSKTLTDMPQTMVFNFVFSLVAYWMIGLTRGAGAFFQFFLVLFLVTTFAESLGLAVSVLVGDAQSSSTLIPIVVVLYMLSFRTILTFPLLFIFAFLACSGGFFIASDQLPEWIGWFRYTSFIFYGFNAMGNIEFPPSSTQADVQNVRDVLELNNFSYWISVCALVGMTLIMKTVGFLSLKYLRGPKFLKF